MQGWFVRRGFFLGKLKCSVSISVSIFKRPNDGGEGKEFQRRSEAVIQGLSTTARKEFVKEIQLSNCINVEPYVQWSRYCQRCSARLPKCLLFRSMCFLSSIWISRRRRYMQVPVHPQVPCKITFYLVEIHAINPKSSGFWFINNID